MFIAEVQEFFLEEGPNSYEATEIVAYQMRLESII